MTPVPCEQFVAAVARQRYCHFFSGQLTNAVRRYRGTVGIGLIVNRGEFVQQLVIVDLDGFLRMLGGVTRGDDIGVFGFIVAGLVECDRTGLDRCL